MALDLGTLAARLTLDDEEFKRGLRRAPQAAEQTGKRIGDSAHRGARPGMAKLGGLFAGLGIAKLTGDLLGFGLKTAMGMEKANISFTTLLGSGKRAQTFMEGLKKFAATTPFEFPELQTAASKMLASGISANKIIPILTTLGNVTSGMGTGAEGVNRATVALQQMNAAGKITGEDLNQLRDAGIPVYDLLAAATGRSTAEVSKLAQAGKLGGKDLAAMMKALETGKGLEKFNGLMGAQSQSLEGIISTLKDTVGQGLADALTPLIPVIKEGIGSFTAALPGVIGGIQVFGKWIADNKDSLGYWAKALGVVGGAFLALNVIMSANPISLVVIAIAALVAGLLWAYDNVKWFRDGVNVAFEALGAAGRWLWNNALAPALRGIVTGFAWVVDGIANMLAALGTVPGFEWAASAAVDLRSLAHDAEVAAHNIKDIPSPEMQTQESLKQIDTLNTKIRGIKGKIVEAKAKGDTKEVDRLKAKLDKLRDKKLDVQAHVRKTGVTTIKTIAAGGGLKISAYARGGRFLPGWALVGEAGPELVKFSTSGRVYNNRESRQMLSRGGSGGQTIVYATFNVPINPDIMGLGRQLDELLDQYVTRSGRARLASQRLG